MSSESSLLAAFERSNIFLKFRHKQKLLNKRMKVVEEMMKDRNCSDKMLKRLRRDYNATYRQHLSNAKTVLRAMQTLKTLKYMRDNKLKM